MPVTIQEVEKIMRLARLEFRPAEKVKLRTELDQIVRYVEKLEELDTEGVPATHPHLSGNAFREDRAETGLAREEALLNTPKRSRGFFSVPKVF